MLPPSSKNLGCSLYYGHYQNGKGAYYYKVVSGERVYNGDFRYKQTENNYPDGKIKVSIKGFYENNRKNGTWVYKVKKRGVTQILKVDYVKGLHQGIYSFKSFKRGLFFNTNKLMIELSMLDNHPVGDIKYKSEHGKLKGTCNNEGQPDGTWSMDLSTTNICKIDYDLWDNGTLKDCYTFNTSTGKRKPRKGTLPNMLSSFIYRECYEIESIIREGSRKWEGNITLI
ncbi:MAG: hypothetical protein Q4D41_03465 [Prevotellaceae bacterium]|nr:hypothetical protein [Prevotellaceae bacterium]